MAVVPDDTIKILCHCCGERNELGVVFCWQCGHYAQKTRAECPACNCLVADAKVAHPAGT